MVGKNPGNPGLATPNLENVAVNKLHFGERLPNLLKSPSKLVLPLTPDADLGSVFPLRLEYSNGRRETFHLGPADHTPSIYVYGVDPSDRGLWKGMTSLHNGA